MSYLNAYVLDEDAEHILVERPAPSRWSGVARRLANRPEEPAIKRWMEFALAGQRERGLVLRAGERLRTPALKIAGEPVLWMRSLPWLSEAGMAQMDVEIWQCANGNPERLLLTQRMEPAQIGADVREVEFALPIGPDDVFQLEIRCGSVQAEGMASDKLGLIGLAICLRHELALRKAQSQHGWRLANEIAHFGQVYSGDFYRDRQVDRDGATVGPLRSLPDHGAGTQPSVHLRDTLRERIRDVSPNLTENAFGYAHRMLQVLIPQVPPDFATRLRLLSKVRGGRPIRWLALCAGTASIEGALLEAAEVPVELCLLDVNANLLEAAANRMPANVSVDRVLGNANEIDPGLGRFDIVNITSGLHHLVELEHVLDAIARMLAPDGEFWLIGEQVGRNGSRLWPEAMEMANAIFSSWPPEKRRNHNTGRVDDVLPDLDCSSASFEGIRSQDINELLGRYFLPVDCYMRNAFLWRLVDVAYAANFDLQNEHDRQLLSAAVVEEALLWGSGARCTELHGVFCSKWACLGSGNA